ncbi:hypothetical protein JYU34_011120 [Plutella xylostella]|uniref:Uncharacterized protein n=1 Tax=Plutella xylostella TaxID=51655 RepID=A0ABQ7QHE6_PLUXY|nr:hypothetical protein JYU34_011120 [Plutella xylostella]
MLHLVLILCMFTSQSSSSSTGFIRPYREPPTLLHVKGNPDQFNKNAPSKSPFVQNDDFMEEYIRDALAMNHRVHGPKKNTTSKGNRDYDLHLIPIYFAKYTKLSETQFEI